MIALPFILIYINNRNGINKEIRDFIFSFSLFSFLFIGSYILSNGYFLMVFQSREFSRLYSVFVLYGQDLKLYVVPIIYFLSLYLIWRLKRINQDLFIIFSLNSLIIYVKYKLKKGSLINCRTFNNG